MKPRQPDLFPTPRPVPAVPAVSPRYAVEPFDAWDLTRMVPRPGAVIPDECRLPTDDENWQPGSG
jgi:hypothetical protein